MYGRQYNSGGSDAWTEFRRFVRRSAMPATLTLIGVSVLTWFLSVFAARAVPVGLLAFATPYFPFPAIWSALTWPFLSMGNPIFVLFAAFWAYTIGGSLERSWGTRPFVLFFFATTALMSLSVWLGSALLHTPAVLSGLWAGIAPITVAWCLLNKREQVMLYFMPVPAMFIAYLSMLLLWWQVGPPFLGFFALIPCAAAWWYVEKGRYRSGYASEGGFRSPFGNSGDSRSVNAPRPSVSNRGGISENGSGFNPVRWWKRRQENRKLEAMFRNSGFDDEPDKKR